MYVVIQQGVINVYDMHSEIKVMLGFSYGALSGTGHPWIGNPTCHPILRG